MILEQITYSLQNLIHRKMRSGLTIVSILIGVMAVFALISFGLGIRKYMDVLAQQAGTDKLFIFAKGAGAPGTNDQFVITQSEVDFVSRINGVKQISGMYSKPIQITFKKEKKYKLPDFLIIGAQKAGTTSFWSDLKKHPQIEMSPNLESFFREGVKNKKEVHFFDLNSSEHC